MTPKIDILVSALKGHISRDTRWCRQHLIANLMDSQGELREAVASVIVSGKGVTATLDLCADCHRARMAKPLPNDAGSEPVEQPVWAETARQLIAEIEGVTTYLKQTGNLPPAVAAPMTDLLAQPLRGQTGIETGIDAQALELQRATGGGKSQSE